jgi:hypothetical protein
MRQNEFAGQMKRFIADAEGAIVSARNRAIDDQTRVELRIDAQGIQIWRFDQTQDTWVFTLDIRMIDQTSALLLADNVCIRGLTPGVQAPAQAQAVAPPNDCVQGVQNLRFEPDGSFSDPDGAWSAGVPNAGASFWIADDSVPGTTKLALVQIFPGGLIRTFEGLQ